MIEQVYDVLGADDRDHPAAAMFDTQEFIDAAIATCGLLPESTGELPFIGVPDRYDRTTGVLLHQWRGHTSALVSASGPFDALESTITTLLPLVVERNLMLYDPQVKAVYNNRRQYPPPDAG
jgi:hypothetical protein